MNAKIFPFDELIGMVKSRTRFKDSSMEAVIREGCEQVLNATKKRRSALRDNFRLYPVPDDLSRKLRNLKKLELADFFHKRKNFDQFVFYAAVIFEGLAAEMQDELKLNSIRTDIKNYLNLIEEALNSNPSEPNEANMQEEMKAAMEETVKMKVVKLNNLVEKLLDDMNVLHDEETWEQVDLPQYDRLIAMRKHATLLFASDLGDAAFSLIEEPLAKKWSLISMKPMEEVAVVQYDDVEEALSEILDYINNGYNETKLDMLERKYVKTYDIDGTGKTYTYAYETIASLGEKIDYLLPQRM
jgi:hypothetical protein